MRRPSLALFSGIGRRIAWAIIVGGLAVLALGLLLQAGKQQRQYRDMHQQQLRLIAAQTAGMIRIRLGNAEVLLRMQVDGMPGDAAAGWSALRAQLQRAPQFESVAILPAAEEAAFMHGMRRFELGADGRDALENGRTLLLSARDPAGAGRLFLLRDLPEPRPARRVLAELRGSWLWSQLDEATGVRLAVFDGTGHLHFGSQPGAGSIAPLVTAQLAGPPAAVSDLSWNESGAAWVGAMSRIGSSTAISDLSLVMVAMEHDRPWSVAFWSALRTQSTMLPLLLLLAAWFAHGIAARHLGAFRQLRRALTQLPERHVNVPAEPRLFQEVHQLVEAFNRSADAIGSQNETRRVLDEIDALLLPGGDYENVLDQVLTRVRNVTRANNVGLTLVDPGVAGHGRLYVVNAGGGSPVNRVVLDEEMVASLRDAELGMTIMRCEEGRHSFLEPLQEAGSGFFWVWPVMAAGELAAILAVGYTDPPEQASGIARSGTLCAQRLGLLLSSSARAEQLYRQAHFDPLTQLPNRLLFRDQLERELQNAQHHDACGALLFIDLDHFKRVNDSLGHEAGDQLLSIVAQRLRASVKEVDTVARLGGDEFTVILREVADAGEVSAVADRIIQSMLKPVRLGSRDHHVQASIGITMFPADGTGIDALLHNADLAMYRAKDLGRGGAAFYNPKMGAHGTRVADSGLYRALKRREFFLYFQPQYRVGDGSLVGLEVLLRWHKPREGLVASADFIPAAEESGLIVDLGGWVIEAACAQIAQWREAGLPVPRVAINLSVQQLRDPELIANVRRHLERHRVSPNAIEFEMNEAALTDPESQPCIEALSALGVGLTLDDFGTGNTALANLRRYPVSAVKIDRSFVEQLSGSAAAGALASTIIVMAHSLGKLVIAEGVETLDQLDYLRERGCDAAQGYFMARPMSAADMADMLMGRVAAREVTSRSANA